tara:strand:- start:23897 stop:25384 length:1488 start_codon:yes stop_codon:yes gene_type:complete
MLTKLLSSLTPNYQKLKRTTVFILIFLVSFFIRLPFFFRDYIDRDESTFIIMGQSWAEGHLPFIELWDLKPPINFLFFAGIIYLFGKSMIAIRFFGVLIVAITAFFTYKIAIKVSTLKIAFWSAIFCVFFQSLFGSMQGVMSEHISMVFFMPALYLLIKYNKWYWVALAGILMGLTCMVKLNMAYPIAFIGLYQLYNYYKNGALRKGIYNSLFYGFGILLVIFLTILPYYLKGTPEIWWNSVIEAPLVYASSRRSSIFSFAPLVLILLLFLYVSKRKKYLNFNNPDIQISIVVTITVILSFIKGGRINGHYLIQLYPILLILIGIVLGKLSFPKNIYLKPLCILMLLLIPLESYLEYTSIFKNKVDKGTFFNGEGIEIPHYLIENNIDTSNIFFSEYHIGYWYLNAKPPTKAATHPSNVYKSELYPFFNNPRTTALEEITFILEDLEPQIIVRRKGSLILDKKLIDENIYVNEYLNQNYKVLTSIGKSIIYQRLN